jgi:hypothetical protein
MKKVDSENRWQEPKDKHTRDDGRTFHDVCQLLSFYESVFTRVKIGCFVKLDKKIGILFYFFQKCPPQYF